MRGSGHGVDLPRSIHSSRGCLHKTCTLQASQNSNMHLEDDWLPSTPEGRQCEGRRDALPCRCAQWPASYAPGPHIPVLWADLTGHRQLEYKADISWDRDGDGNSRGSWREGAVDGSDQYTLYKYAELSNNRRCL